MKYFPEFKIFTMASKLYHRKQLSGSQILYPDFFIHDDCPPAIWAIFSS